MENERWSFSKEIHGNRIFFASALRDDLYKKLALEYLSSFIRKDDISIPLKYDFIWSNDLLTSNWYDQIFLYHCKLRFVQIKSVQVWASQNAVDFIKTPFTRWTKNIISWSISFVERTKKFFWQVLQEMIQVCWLGSQNFFANFNLTCLFWPLVYYIFWEILNPLFIAILSPVYSETKSATSIWLFIPKLN